MKTTWTKQEKRKWRAVSIEVTGVPGGSCGGPALVEVADVAISVTPWIAKEDLKWWQRAALHLATWLMRTASPR